MRPWFLLPVLLLCVSCSDGGTHSGSLPEPADFLPMVSGSAEASQPAAANVDTMPPDSSEQPRLILRCEEGRVNAYIVANTPAPESHEADAHAVPVVLDSAPSC